MDTTYAEKRQARAEKLQGFLQEVAEHLTEETGYSWVVDESKGGSEWRGYLKTVAAMKVVGEPERPVPYRLFVDASKGAVPHCRLYVSCLYPQSEDGGSWNTPEVKISADSGRGAEAVAGDIVRRLLPRYDDALEAVIGRINGWEAHEAKKDAIRRGLLEADPAAEEGRSGDISTRYQSGDPTWEARPGADYVYEFKIKRMDLATARKVIAILREARGEQ